MAELTAKTVSELPAVSALTDSTLFVVSSGGESKKAELSSIKNFVALAAESMEVDVGNYAINSYSSYKHYVFKIGKLCFYCAKGLKNLTVNQNVVVATLPTGWRPQATASIHGTYGSATVAFTISTNGTIEVLASESTEYVDLVLPYIAS